MNWRIPLAVLFVMLALAGVRLHGSRAKPEPALSASRASRHQRYALTRLAGFEAGVGRKTVLIAGGVYLAGGGK